MRLGKLVPPGGPPLPPMGPMPPISIAAIMFDWRASERWLREVRRGAPPPKCSVIRPGRDDGMFRREVGGEPRSGKGDTVACVGFGGKSHVEACGRSRTGWPDLVAIDTFFEGVLEQSAVRRAYKSVEERNSCIIKTHQITRERAATAPSLFTCVCKDSQLVV